MISVVNARCWPTALRAYPALCRAACVGDGATSTGSFHETVNQAAVGETAVVLVVANNHYAYSTPIERQFAAARCSTGPPATAFQGREVDGTQLSACLQVVAEGRQPSACRRWPQVVVAQLLRLCGHGEHDDASYVDPRLKQSSIGRDCLKLAEAQLLENQWVDGPR